MQGFAHAKPGPATPARSAQPVGKPHRHRNTVAQILSTSGTQAKLKLGATNDALEQEADQTAEQVVAAPEHSPAQPPPPKVRDITQERSDGSGTEETDLLPDDLEARIQALTRGGHPLPPALRQYMESRFGRDFSRVRIHTDQEAAQVSEGIQAHAFTLGHHIAFNQGAFDPDSTHGKTLIAHELTHVVQQTGDGQADSGQVHRSFIGDLRERGGRLVGAGLDMARGAYDRLTDAVGDVVDSAGDFITSKGLKVVEHLAPGLLPILEEGPVEWFKGKLGTAFDDLVERVEERVPGNALELLTEGFGNLLERAGDIFEALASGDCEPLFEALGQLRSFVTDMAGSAWDRLKNFLSPISDFFSDLWDSTAAPAAEFLGDFASDIWSDIKATAGRIWDWSEPLRDQLGAAWDWVKEQLFGSDNDSQGSGLLDRVKGKAEEAWTWVKNKTRPLWEPIKEGLDQLNELIPPDFLEGLGEQMESLADNLGEAQQNLGDEEQPGDSLAQNRTALADALPSLETVIERVREILASSGSWLANKVGNLNDQVGEFFTSLGKFDMIRPLAAPLSWLERGIDTLSDWASNKVEALFDRTLEAFDRLSPFIERALSMVRHVISVVADLAELPPMLVSSAWERIPECIRNPVQAFVTDQILARIPVFRHLLELPDLWEQLQAIAMRILRQVFVDGDLAGAAWSFFKAVLEVIGLPPELVRNLLINAAGSIGQILQDPIGFVFNAMKAAGKGFSQFFSNISSHLLGGIGTWLFGKMREGGIEPPEDFSLRSLLGVVLQILDITTDRIFNRIGERVGASTAARLRQVLEHATGAWQFARTLVEEGPGALWEDLQERLSDLGDRVLDSVVRWVSTTVMIQVSTRMAPLLAPTGVSNVVAAILEVYRAAQALASQVQEILEVLNSFLEGLGEIASGSLSQAADFLENALSNSIPAAMGLFAQYAGFGNLAERIQEMLEEVRERVDSALGWLIDQAIERGQDFLDLVRQGAGAVRRGAANLRNWWRARREFKTDEGETHSLYLEERGSAEQLMLASNPISYREFVDNIPETTSLEGERQAAMDLADQLEHLTRQSNELETEQETTEGGLSDYDDRRSELTEEINERFSRLETVTRTLMDNRPESDQDAPPSSRPSYGSQVGAKRGQGFGSQVSIDILTSNHQKGTPAEDAPDNKDYTPLTYRRTSSNQPYYVRGHLWNEDLGGPASWNNLVPLTQGANLLNSDSMFRNFEKPVKEAVDPEGDDQGVAVNYIVTAHYDSKEHPRQGEILDLETRSDEGDEQAGKLAKIIKAEKQIPASLTCEATVVNTLGNDDYKEGQSIPTNGPVKVDNEFETDEDKYNPEGVPKTPIYLSDKNPDDIAKLDGIDDAIANEILNTAQDLSAGHYRTHAQVVEKNANIEPALWQRARESRHYTVLLYRRNKESSDE